MSEIKKLIEKVARKMDLPDWVNDKLKEKNIKLCDECKLMIKEKTWVEINNIYLHCECFYKNYTPLEKQQEA